MKCLLNRLIILFSNGICNNYVCAERDAEERVNDQRDDRSICSYRCHARLAEFAREVSYYRDVGSIEELLKDARKCQRKSKPEDLIPQASFSHRFSGS